MEQVPQTPQNTQTPQSTQSQGQQGSTPRTTRYTDGVAQYTFNGKNYNTKEEAVAARNTYKAAVNADWVSVGKDRAKYDALIESGRGLSQMSDDELGFIRDRYSKSDLSKRKEYTKSDTDAYLYSMGLPSSKELNSYRQKYIDYMGKGGIEQYPELAEKRGDNYYMTDTAEWIKNQWAKDNAEGLGGETVTSKGKDIKYEDTLLDEQLKAEGFPPASQLNEYYLKYKDEQKKKEAKEKDLSRAENLYKDVLNLENKGTDRADAWKKVSDLPAYADLSKNEIASFEGYERYYRRKADEKKWAAYAEKSNAVAKAAEDAFSTPALTDVDKKAQSKAIEAYLNFNHITDENGNPVKVSDYDGYLNLINIGVPQDVIASARTQGISALEDWNLKTNGNDLRKYAAVEAEISGISKADGDYGANVSTIERTRSIKLQSNYKSDSIYDVTLYDDQVIPEMSTSRSTAVSIDGALYNAVNGKEYGNVVGATETQRELLKDLTSTQYSETPLIDYMTDDERAAFNVEFKKSPKSALSYLSDLQSILEKRQALYLQAGVLFAPSKEIAEKDAYSMNLQAKESELNQKVENQTTYWEKEAWDRYSGYSDEALQRIVAENSEEKQDEEAQRILSESGAVKIQDVSDDSLGVVRDIANARKYAQYVLDVRKDARDNAKVVSSLYGYTSKEGEAATKEFADDPTLLYQYGETAMVVNGLRSPDGAREGMTGGEAVGYLIRHGWKEGSTEELAFEMTDDERNRYNWLLVNDGAQSANAYYNYIKTHLDDRSEARKKEHFNAITDKSNVGATLLSVLAYPASGIASVGGNIMNAITGTELTKSQATGWDITGGLREGVQQNITEMIDNEGLSSVVNFLYGVTTSSLDSGVGGALSALTGTDIGAIFLSMSAYSSTLRSGLDRGLSAEQANSLAIASGVIEYVTEKMGIDHLISGLEAAAEESAEQAAKGLVKGDVSQQFMQYLKNVATQAGINFIPEALEEGVGNVFQTAADMLINGDKAEVVENYNAYIAEGKTPEEAKKLAARQFAKDTALEAFAGGLAGSQSVVVGGAANAAWRGATYGFSSYVAPESTRAYHGHSLEYARGKSVVTNMFGTDFADNLQTYLDTKESVLDKKTIDDIAKVLPELRNTDDPFLHDAVFDDNGNVKLSQDEITALAAALDNVGAEANLDSVEQAWVDFKAGKQSPRQRLSNINIDFIKDSQSLRQSKKELQTAQEAIETAKKNYQTSLEDAQAKLRDAESRLQAVQEKKAAVESSLASRLSADPTKLQNMLNALLASESALITEVNNHQDALNKVTGQGKRSMEATIKESQGQINSIQQTLDRHYASYSNLLATATTKRSVYEANRNNALANAAEIGKQIDSLIDSNANGYVMDSNIEILQMELAEAQNEARMWERKMNKTSKGTLDGAIAAAHSGTVKDYVASLEPARAVASTAETSQGTEAKIEPANMADSIRNAVDNSSTEQSAEQSEQGEEQKPATKKPNAEQEKKSPEKKTYTISKTTQERFNRIAKKFGLEIVWQTSDEIGGNGKYDPDTPNKIYLATDMIANKGLLKEAVVAKEFFTHEVVHYVANTKWYQRLSLLAEAYYKYEGDKEWGGGSGDDYYEFLIRRQQENEKTQHQRDFTREQAREELTAYFVQDVLFGAENGDHTSLNWLTRMDGNAVQNFLATVEYLIKRGQVRRMKEGSAIKTLLLESERALAGAIRERKILDNAGLSSSFSNEKKGEKPKAEQKTAEQTPEGQQTDMMSNGDTIADLSEGFNAEYPMRLDNLNSPETYSYDHLTSQPPTEVVSVSGLSAYQANGKIDRNLVRSAGLANSAKEGRQINEDRAAVVNKYTGREMQISGASIRHGLNGEFLRLATNSKLGAVIGSLSKNAIPVNGLVKKNDAADYTYAMAAAGTDGENDYLAIIHVDHYSNRVSSVDLLDVVHSLNGRIKINSAAVSPPSLAGKAPTSLNAVSTITIANLLDLVKEFHPDVLSEDVLNHYGITERPEGYYNGNVLFSTGSTIEDLSNGYTPLESIDDNPNASGMAATLSGDDVVVTSASEAFDKNAVLVNSDGDPIMNVINNGNAAMFSTSTFDAGGRQALDDYLKDRIKKNKIDQGQADYIKDEMERIYDLCKELEGKYVSFGNWGKAKVEVNDKGKPVFSIIRSNSEYPMNIDFSLVCVKRRALDAVFNEVIKQGKMEDIILDDQAIVLVNEAIRKYEFETACTMCFVEAKRFQQQSAADRFVEKYNNLVKSLGGEADYFNFGGNESDDIKGRAGIRHMSDDQLNWTEVNKILDEYNKKTEEVRAKAVEDARKALSEAKTPKQKKDAAKKMKAAPNKMAATTVEEAIALELKNNPASRRLVLRGDFMSTRGFDSVAKRSPSVLSLYNKQKGTGGPKASFGDMQYLNDIENKKWDAEKAYAVGGVRVQSFSDFVPYLAFDYVQMIADLAAGKLPAHAYTKEKAFAFLFGMTGMKINLSLVPMVSDDNAPVGLMFKRDANGNIVKDAKGKPVYVYAWAAESFGYDRKKGDVDYNLINTLQGDAKYGKNCGSIAIGVSEEQIRMMLRDPNIKMVIPYHKSSLNPIVAKMENIDRFSDYTGEQHTRKYVVEDGEGKWKNVSSSEEYKFNERLRQLKDPKAVVAEYLAWCKEKNYKPKFDEFTNEEGYYKVLEDFSLYDNDGNYTEQGAVQMNFPKKEDSDRILTALGKELKADDPVGFAKFLSDALDNYEKYRMITDEAAQDLAKEVLKISDRRRAERGEMYSDGTSIEDLGSDFNVDDAILAEDINPDDYLNDVLGDIGTNNSPVEPAQYGTPQFREWFGNSKAVKNGEPMHLYHRTNATFDTFDLSKSGSNQGNSLGDGIYLSTSKGAFDYAGGNVMDLYASIQNPFEMELTEEEANEIYDKYAAPNHPDRFGTYKSHAIGKLMSPIRVFDYIKQYAEENNVKPSDILKELGYDGVHSGIEWVAFDPWQVKSATGNNGDYSKSNDNIYYSTGNTIKDLSEGYTPRESIDDIRRIFNERGNRSADSDDTRYMSLAERYRNGDMSVEPELREMVEGRAKANNAEVFAATDVPAYRIRRDAPPKKTIKVYKTFTLTENGEPSALFVSSQYPLPVGVWLDAQDTYHFKNQRNGRWYVPSTKNPNTKGGATGGSIKLSDISEQDLDELKSRGYLKKIEKGKNKGQYPTSLTALAYRPGWHAGDLPFFPQGGMEIEGSNYENAHRYNQVIFECELAADEDYTSYHITKEGTVSYHDMQKMPTNGSYKFSTNPMAKSTDIGAWYIGGSLKINRALTEQEANEILAEHGRKPQEWQAYQDEEELKSIKGEANKRAYEKRFGSLDLDRLGYDPNRTAKGMKLPDLVTYDDNGDIIPLSQRFNPEVDDVRYSTGTTMADLIAEYGKKRQSTEGKLNDIQTPERISKTYRVSDVAQTLKETKGATQLIKDNIDAIVIETLDENAVPVVKVGDNAGLVYKPMTMEEMEAIGEEYVTRAGSLDQAMRDLARDIPNTSLANLPNIEAAAMRVFREIAQTTNYDLNAFGDFVAAVGMMNGTWGRMGRVMQILNNSPIGRRKYMEKVVERINNENAKAFSKGVDKLMHRNGIKKIEIPEHMYLDLQNATTPEEVRKAEFRISEEIGKQSPLSVANALRNWRYFAMLGNPVTHERNILGNVSMLGMRVAKDAVASGLESLAVKTGLMSEEDRTHAINLKVSKDVHNAAVDMYLKHREEVQGQDRYGVRDKIHDAVKKSPIKFIDKLMRINGDMLEQEDGWFLRLTYVAAAKQYITAKGIDVNNMTDKQKAEINAYAKQQAQEATYRDASALADTLNQLSRKGGLWQFAIEGVIPFKKTPVNIAKRGVLEYSPIGLLKGIYDTAKYAYDKGKNKNGQYTIPAAKIADELGKGIVGSALALIGFFLAKAGILKLKAGNGDRDEQFEKDLGRQDYSLEIGDLSIKIESIAPMTFPLFAGAACVEAMGAEGSGLQALGEAMLSIADPLMDMSFMSSLNNVLDSYNKNKLLGIAENTVTSYMSQFLPTAVGRFNNVIAKDRRTTKSSQAAKETIGTQADYTLRSFASKIPFMNLALQRYVKTTGEYDSKAGLGDYLLSIMNNFGSPVNVQIIKTDAAKDEIVRLVEQTGNVNFIPKNPSKYFTQGGKQYNLNAKEYTEYSKDHNETVWACLVDTINSEEYQNASDDERSDMLEKAYKNSHNAMLKKWKAIIIERRGGEETE